jgi:hypothetical protein
MALDVRPLRTPNNIELLNAIRGVGSLDYQRRIPAADKSNIQEVVNDLRNNRPAWNEFSDSLVNRVGLELYKNRIWSNPLAKFKIGMLEAGDTIEEIMVGLVEAKRYDPDRDELERELLGQERPRVDASYHKINRMDRYKITVNEVLLKRAFDNEFGLNRFVNGILDAPQTSDNWDEFLLMASLFKEMWRTGSFFKIAIPDISSATSNGDDARVSLRRMREVAENLQFISERYNAAHMPTAANPEDLELFITPEALAAQDVEALAGAFNIEKANFSARTTVIPKEHFNIPGAQAVLTTRDFFVVADTYMDTRQFQNPAGLTTNYWLHHHQVISASRFVPAILFTSAEEGTVIDLDTYEVTSTVAPTVTDRNGQTVTKVQRGEVYNVDSVAVTTPAGGDNDAVRYVLTGNESERTWITHTGTLVVAPDESAQSLTITDVAVDNEYISNSATVTVYGALVAAWPDPEVIEDADNDGLNEVVPEGLTVDSDDNVTIPEVRGVQYKMGGVNVNNGSVQHITGSTVFTAEPRSGFELAPGATASWTLAP